MPLRHVLSAVVLLALGVLAALPAAAQQTYFNPTIDGYRLDICREWGANCGKPAADAFCQRMGFAGSSQHQAANDIGAHSPTKVISSGQVCDQGFCDGFAAITCVGGGHGPGPGGGNRVFTNPTINGYRLDICREWGTNCGKPAADAFCRLSGFSHSTHHQAAMDIGAHSPTMVISTGQVCDQSFCDGFTSITCAGGGSGGGPGPGPGGGPRVFNNPAIDGYRLDICREWGANCGKPAADAFCQRMGFSRSVNHNAAMDIGAHHPTKVISSGQICDQGFCDGFSSITCE